MEESIYDRYFNLSLRFLSYRPRSEKEVYDYLLEKSKKGKGKKLLDEKIISKIMKRLIELKFINDYEFTKFWIENRKKGSMILKQELFQKGISKETMERVFNETNVEEKDEKLIQKLWEKKLKSLSKYSKEEQYKKMAGFLIRRGFNWEDIKKQMKTLRNQ